MSENELSLMSFSIGLYGLGDQFAARLTNLDSLSEESLLVLLDSLSYCRTRLMERLTFEHDICFDGVL
jgi:hypothetical protein